MRWSLRAGVTLLLLSLGFATTRPVALAGAPGDDLPEGAGRVILQASCTTCHDLSEVTKLRGYYTKEQWRDLVKTMIEYGAELNEDQAEVLTDYLFAHLGKKD